MKGKSLRGSANGEKMMFEHQDIDNDEIQSSLLAHYIQTYLSHSTNKNTCGCLPVPFERASSHSWIRPCFDSDILEDQFITSSAAHVLRRFRYALAYLLIVNSAWLCFAIYSYLGSITIPIIFSTLIVCLSLAYYASYRPLYSGRPQLFSAIVALILAVGALLFTLTPSSTLSHFTVVSYSIIVIYTMFPLPPYVSLIICMSLTAAFNVAEYFQTDFSHFPQGLFLKLVCLICMNIIGFHIVVMLHVRMRGTFMKVGQRLLVRRQLEAEKQLKEKMIHSVMPPKVARWLLNPNPSLSDSSGEQRSSSTGDIRTLFRPFNMVRMENVSILFADIVGFTRMSSNKTAEQIVDILNDLFNRFDDLCILSGCEKISTLGDCYYCVSGCPEPREDHAKCCVEMGLGMIDAIQEFDVERSEDVNMRVGVHTGTVLCGVVGTRRFKFDVWSNDVSFANKLESTGLAGRVHVSEQTVQFLDNTYLLDDYQSSLGVKTYLITSRSAPPSTHVRMTLPSPPPSPASSAKPASRKRLHSYNSGQKRPHYLSLITDVRSKFTSLPNVLAGSSTQIEEQSKNQASVPVKSSSIRWQFPFPRSWRVKEEPLNMSVMERLGVPKQEHALSTDEELSLCPSATSRKDSGIKSSSRRSSIQQQIYILNNLGQQELMTHRVSGYFTSSRSSLPHSSSDCDASESCRVPNDDGFGTCFYSLRKQSDLQLIRCVRDITQHSYFVKVPLQPLTLQFRSNKMEADYRKHAHHINENIGDSPVTLSTPRYNTFLDIIVAFMVLTAITTAVCLVKPPPSYLLIVAAFALIIQMTALALCFMYLSQGSEASTQSVTLAIISLFSNWYEWHVFGTILVSMPMLLSLIGFTHGFQHSSIMNITSDLDFLRDSQLHPSNVEFFDYYYTFLLLASLVHFCNFIQLNSFLKGVIAVISIVIFTSLIFMEQCQLANAHYVGIVSLSRFLGNNIFLMPASGLRQISLCCADIFTTLAACQTLACFNQGDFILSNLNSTNSSILYATENGHKLLNFISQTQNLYPYSWKEEVTNGLVHFISYDHYELLMNILIVLFLIILLNRELETNYRGSYFFNVESNKDKFHVQHLKNQADMLLENIIPKHVSEELKNRAKYCENHTDVGIIFASIVNFNMLYEETYSGGKEYLRYLNELISDFDELLSKFPNVEKIKTIGSTFMAASGLNPELRKKNPDEFTHIHELMEFATEMYKVLEAFNSDLLGFTLVLRVGFNIGEVTAGVIGSTKLLYDIWGDTVNVASRMDSTGVEGRIQVPSSSLKYLESKYEFEPRGSVFVKGKGDIMVYLLKS